MEAKLVRDVRTDRFTLGQLYLDGAYECYTCEDQVRPDGKKVYGATAIPEGRYRVVITHSPRFNRPLPLLLEVPGFEGIRIHPGNSTGDTEGCILPGRARDPDGGRVMESRFAFEPLFAKLQAALQDGGEVWLEILSLP
ncbi:MAG TPA: DUF5675 family protein [Burkholderiales bacterium]|nr:DUF5675 family protein [Burkholderiales bacterium]